MAHPTALRSLDNLTKVLTPAGPMQTYSGVSKQGQQITFDENGKAIAAEDVPGFKTGQEAGTGTGKTFPQTYTKPDGTPGTRQMQYTRGPNGLLQAQPVEGSEGEIKQTGKQAGAAAGLVPSDIAGLPPQVTADIPKTAFNRQNMNALEATPTVMAALDRMKTAAAGMGPVKGPVSALSGEYFGLNGTGAQFKADMDLIRTQAPLVMGSGYKAAVEAFMTGIGSTSNAPSFLRLQANQMQTAMRNRAQEMADAETTSHQGKLPPSLANQLIGQGVVPNGYQNQTTFDRMPAGEAPLWKSRYAPQAINHEDQVSLFTDAAHGKFGPLDNPSDDLKNVLQIHQNFKTQQQAKAQQGTASTAAANASAGNAGQLVSGLGVQPAEGTEPGAQQPEQAGEQPQQPAQQQPQQGAEQPQAQPQGQQQLGQQGQGDQSGQNIPLSPQQQPLMPPTAVPGQPAQGVPGTDGVTPLPPANPLPKTSQMLTPQGSVPTPGSQAPTQDTAPKVSEPEVPSPYSPTFSGM
jgi:hypothetical protein